MSSQTITSDKVRPSTAADEFDDEYGTDDMASREVLRAQQNRHQGARPFGRIPECEPLEAELSKLARKIKDAAQRVQELEHVASERKQREGDAYTGEHDAKAITLAEAKLSALVQRRDQVEAERNAIYGQHSKERLDVAAHEAVRHADMAYDVLDRIAVSYDRLRRDLSRLARLQQIHDREIKTIGQERARLKSLGQRVPNLPGNLELPLHWADVFRVIEQGLRVADRHELHRLEVPPRPQQTPAKAPAQEAE